MRMEILVPGSGGPYLEGDDLDRSAPLVFTVPGVLGEGECRALIARFEQRGFAAAPINAPGGFVLRPDLRNNERVMFDDVALAAGLFARVEGQLPARVCGGRPAGINERIRCYRYAPGQRFAPHYDGYYQRSGSERSELTFMIYLNDDFTGGATAFLDLGVTVRPVAGMALVFQHALLHEGCVIASGTKYALRSDVMYAG